MTFHMRNAPAGTGALEGVISKVDSRDNTDAAPNLQAAADLIEGLRLLAAVELIVEGLRLLPDGHVQQDALLSLLATFDYGPPGIPWNDIEDEARDWASWASRRELRAYASAAAGRLPDADRRHLALALGGQ